MTSEEWRAWLDGFCVTTAEGMELRGWYIETRAELYPDEPPYTPADDEGSETMTTTKTTVRLGPSAEITVQPSEDDMTVLLTVPPHEIELGTTEARELAAALTQAAAWHDVPEDA